MFTCPNCGFAVEEDATACPECGANLQDETKTDDRTETPDEAQTETQNETQDETRTENETEPRVTPVADDSGKVLGNSMEKNMFFGLVWIGYCIPGIALIAWILNLVVLFSDKDKLTVEEKRCHGSMLAIVVIKFVITTICGITVIPYIGWLLGLIVWPVSIIWAIAAVVFSIIAAVKAFQGTTFRIPLAYQLASLFVK